MRTACATITQMAEESFGPTDTTSHGQAAPAAQGGACLVHIYGSELGRRHLLSGPVTLGRDAGNEVVLVTTSASRRHARLFEQHRAWHVEDLGSTNGTYVNGRGIAAATRLANGDLLKLGGVVLKFIEGDNLESLYHEAIHRLAILDGLTGVHNRRALVEFLDRELARAVRHERPLSLALFDVDGMNRVNDEHGHLIGDQVLQKLASLVSRVVRKDELLARYGGGTFAVVLPETVARDAVGFGERIRGMVAQEELRCEKAAVRLTVSVGVASVHYGYSVDQFLDAAAAQLAEAKAAGRNRVVSEV